MNALSGSSIKAVEITMNTPGAAEVISKLSSEFEGKILIGAGTVTTLEKAKVAIKSGAKFILSPVMLSKEIIDLCKENSVISVPGTMSPTEIYKSYKDGADIIKVFPATNCGSEFFKGVNLHTTITTFNKQHDIYLKLYNILITWYDKQHLS